MPGPSHAFFPVLFWTLLRGGHGRIWAHVQGPRFGAWSEPTFTVATWGIWVSRERPVDREHDFFWPTELSSYFRYRGSPLLSRALRLRPTRSVTIDTSVKTTVYPHRDGDNNTTSTDPARHVTFLEAAKDPAAPPPDPCASPHRRPTRLFLSRVPPNKYPPHADSLRKVPAVLTCLKFKHGIPFPETG